MKNNIFYSLLLVAVLLILVNILAKSYAWRFDLTADRSYTLNPVSRQLVKQLDRPVTITGFFSDDLPPDLNKAKADFTALIKEYEACGGANIVYELIDPAKDKSLEEKAYRANIQPMILSVREKDQSTQKLVYMGVVVQYEEQEIALPVIQPDISLEYYITMAIKEMTQNEKVTVGVVQGHDEAEVGTMSQLMDILNSLYNVTVCPISDTLTAENCKALVLINPRQPYSDRDLQQLDRYLATGGNLFIGFQTVSFDYAQAEGQPVQTGLDHWLQRKGLIVDDQYVVDADCADIGVRQADATQSVTQVPFPFYPIIRRFEEHPITFGMSAMILQEASPMRFNDSVKAVFTPLLRTSQQSGVISLPYHIMVDRKWTAYDFPQGGLIVGAALEGDLASGSHNRMVVISNGSFPVNGNPPVQLIADHVNFVANAIDWLLDDTGFIALRSKHIISRSIRPLSDQARTTLKWFNLLFPIAAITGYGLIRWKRRERQRRKRMNPDYMD